MKPGLSHEEQHALRTMSSGTLARWFGRRYDDIEQAITDICAGVRDCPAELLVWVQRIAENRR